MVGGRKGRRRRLTLNGEAVNLFSFFHSSLSPLHPVLLPCCRPFKTITIFRHYSFLLLILLLLLLILLLLLLLLLLLFCNIQHCASLSGVTGTTHMDIVTINLNHPVLHPTSSPNYSTPPLLSSTHHYDIIIITTTTITTIFTSIIVVVVVVYLVYLLLPFRRRLANC